MGLVPKQGDEVLVWDPLNQVLSGRKTPRHRAGAEWAHSDELSRDTSPRSVGMGLVRRTVFRSSTISLWPPRERPLLPVVHVK